MILKSIALLVLSLAACGRAPKEARLAEGTAVNDLVGAWDATMSLTQPYPLEPDAPGAREVCGTIGFVQNHGRVAGDSESDKPMQLGVYDIALRRIGLEWNGETAFPAALASSGLGDDGISRAAARDSVRIVLNPGSNERIVLLGSYDGGKIEGGWTARSARGTATGSFSMHPHSNGRYPPQDC